MSVDALAALAGGDAELAAVIATELAQLAADANALRAILTQDAVVTARVLPFNGLTDVLEIAGRRVAAALPPSLRPGDAVRVQVTGFEPDRILLQVLGSGAGVAVDTAPGLPSPSRLPVETSPQPGPADEAAPVQPSAQPAVSVADAVPVMAPSNAAAISQAALRANVTTHAPTAEPLRQPEPVARAASPQRTVAVPAEPTSIEARVAAARATAAGALADVLAPQQPGPPPGGVRMLPAYRAFVPPPQIAPKGASAAPSVPTTPAASGAAPAVRPAGLAAYTEPVALLRALRLPVTPANVASARLALERPAQLPAALAALDRALPNAPAGTAVATLRALLPFVGRIDPQSPVLATQLAAYVDHVVDGAEPKIATRLAAAAAATVAPDADAPLRSPLQPADAPPPIPAAVSAERGVALGGDLKQTMLALAADPAASASAAPALSGAISALTAMQLSAAQMLAARPDGISFTVPLMTPNGTHDAHISVKRDAPQSRGTPLDAANFHIAFVLETAHFGTVAIDLVTVGREVTVDVRSEAAPAVRAFRDALGSLTARLEALHYRVAAAGATLGSTATVSVRAPAPSEVPDPNAVVDRSA